MDTKQRTEIRNFIHEVYSANSQDGALFTTLITKGRALLGITDEEIAHECNASVSTIARWYAGDTVPDLVMRNVVYTRLFEKALDILLLGSLGVGITERQCLPAPIEVPGERITELVTARDNVGYGLAVVEVLTTSQPHHHNRTAEAYTFIDGDPLEVHVGDDVTTIDGVGETVVIPIGVRHVARRINGESWSARISVLTVPAWTPEDHHLD